MWGSEGQELNPFFFALKERDEEINQIKHGSEPDTALPRAASWQSCTLTPGLWTTDPFFSRCITDINQQLTTSCVIYISKCLFFLQHIKFLSFLQILISHLDKQSKQMLIYSHGRWNNFITAGQNNRRCLSVKSVRSHLTTLMSSCGKKSKNVSGQSL